MTTYSTLKSQIAKLEKQAADLYKKEVAVVAAKVSALVQEYGLTAEYLGFMGKPAKVARKARQGKPVAKTAGVPKYRDPDSGKTWTGHGKAPGWVSEALKQGKSKDDFLIGKKATSGKAAAAKAAKSAVSPKVAKGAKFKPGKALRATKPKAPTKKAAVVAKPAKAKTPKAVARKSTTAKPAVAAATVPVTTGAASA